MTSQALPNDNGSQPPTFEALNAMRLAGHPIDLISEAQRAVLSGLTEDEVAVLNMVRARLEAAAPEVEGQAEVKIL